jgi:hypothetical protein
MILKIKVKKQKTGIEGSFQNQELNNTGFNPSFEFALTMPPLQLILFTKIKSLSESKQANFVN